MLGGNEPTCTQGRNLLGIEPCIGEEPTSGSLPSLCRGLILGRVSQNCISFCPGHLGGYQRAENKKEILLRPADKDACVKNKRKIKKKHTLGPS